MYNVTPARTNRGRKKAKNMETTVITTVQENQSAGEKKSNEEPKGNVQENHSSGQSSGEKRSNKEPGDRNQPADAKKKNSEKRNDEKTESSSKNCDQKQSSEKRNLEIVEKTAQECANTEKEKDIPDRGAEALDLELRKCVSTTADHKIKQLLKVTLELRNSLATEIPKNSRVEEMLSKYPVFKSPKPLIANLMLNLPTILKEGELANNVQKCSPVILDLLFAKGLCTFSRSALKTEAQQIMVAFSNLPLVFKKEGAKVPQIVHIVKRDEAFKDISSIHRNLCSPWIMFQKFGGEEVISLMIRSNVVFKIKDPKTAILALMGIYYMAQLPYPAACSMALLFVQGDILKDKGHEADMPLMKKAEEVFRNFLSEQDIFD